MRQALKKTGPILLAIILLIYALKGVSLTDISLHFQRSNYLYVFFCGVTTLAFYYLRGKRWQQPLMSLGYQPTAFRAMVALLSGTVASMIIPASGELTRCATLQRTDGVPIAQGVGSVVAERVIDIFVLGLVLLLTLALEFRRMTTYFTGLQLALPTGWVIAGVLVACLACSLFILWCLRQPSVRQHRWFIKLQTIGVGLWQGFAAIRRLPNPALFIGLTFLSQLLAWASTYLLLLSLDSTRSLPATAALTVLAVSSIGGLAVPTQGGVGTYHFFVSRGLMLYGFTTTEGAVVATYLHAVGFGVNLILSSLSFLILPVLIQRRQDELKQQITNESTTSR